MGIALGAGVGTAFGVVFSDIAIGAAFGAGLGVIAGSISTSPEIADLSARDAQVSPRALAPAHRKFAAVRGG